MFFSIVIPTYNGAGRINNCLDSLQRQDGHFKFEIIVVDDGSTDNTCDVVSSYPNIKYIFQENSGPAKARNAGAEQATGEIVLFTDDDCVPLQNWLYEMLLPFQKSDDIVGVKGAYLTRQNAITARFVQYEYEDKYDEMEKHEYIDFIDTYSAAYKRDVFIRHGGYDTSFPTACAEDVELSYRIANSGGRLVFNKSAIVYHQHPTTIKTYIKKKYKFAYWRMLAVKKNPNKITDSHTPLSMKLQLVVSGLIAPALVGSIYYNNYYIIGLLVIMFGFLAAPFVIKTFKKDKIVGIVSVFYLLLRSNAQLFGVAFGIINALQA